ncbi:hypothetical protein [Microvirga arsenatis]|uniref:Uncharacterized protein n=1 Tax=Microvirga arsenatis TaxID=2692265 RepID=A0ABW9YUT5_9HYPH|nr:hypothetical protein [Microvirga arsenatis]NBJ10941.1 hypothetical protein [Microvirga arsenatis]NBJ24162.1 hypothetical protein [Microvirga arsenatis]
MESWKPLVEHWELAVTFLSLLATLATVTLAYYGMRAERERSEREIQLRNEQQVREDRIRAEQLAREDEIRRIERSSVPRTEFDLECRFLGPVQGEYITDIRIIVHNKSQVRRKFGSIQVPMLGLRSGAPLGYWDRGQQRLEFPEKLLKVDLLPQEPLGRYYYFVEPGIRQVFTYPTKIPSTISHVLLHVRFQSRVDDEHGGSTESEYESVFDEERLFEVKPDEPKSRCAILGRRWRPQADSH